MKTEFDLIVFGATGFTGRLVDAGISIETTSKAK